LDEWIVMALTASFALRAKVFVPSGKMLIEQPVRRHAEIKITIVAMDFIC
jgi:hypothetical protein